ncbi:ABC transporter permease [Flavisphingomonas formosensis]|uniref:ABC transporter permease n=1 Tax=Flavisphingomonas formosensis TaxID=861534 RepID=UPI0012FB2452|nr:ABC transporter permease [Sphingomonas formosensis]
MSTTLEPMVVIAAPPPQRAMRIRFAFRGLLRNRPLAAGAAILTAILLLAIFAPLIAGHDPRAVSVGDRLLPWGADHLLGTDMLGRDIFARILYGARVSLLIGGCCALLSCLFGTVIGMISASSRLSDAIVMRVLDGVMSMPAVLLAIALMAIAGGSATNVIVAVTIVETPRCARLIRGLMLSLRERPYVEAAIAAGSGQIRLLTRHLLPSLMAPLAVQATFIWAASMLIEAALSFIGAGVPPSTPTWGNMIAEARSLWQVKPALIFVPAAALSLTILGVNLLGEGLRQAFDVKAGR